jgi:hypothetical protein
MGASEWGRGKPPNALRAKGVGKEEEEEEEEEERAYVSVTRELLYNILIEFSIPMKQVSRSQ